MRTQVIEEDVKDILLRGRVEGNQYFLPDEQLDRATYTAVNKVLVACGGKWSRYDKAHVFPRDASTGYIFESIEQGHYVDPKKNGYFPTPPHLVARFTEIIDGFFSECTGIVTILEPSAGQGHLLKAVEQSSLTNFATVCYELIDANQKILAEKGWIVRGPNFLLDPPSERFDLVIMNPPFINVEYMDHIELTFSCLKAGGILITILPEMYLQRSGNRAEAFRKFTMANFLMSEQCPENSFVDAGTSISTRILVLGKPGNGAN